MQSLLSKYDAGLAEGLFKCGSGFQPRLDDSQELNHRGWKPLPRTIANKLFGAVRKSARNNPPPMEARKYTLGNPGAFRKSPGIAANL